MSQTIIQFEERCERAGVKPADTLRKVGIHASLWWKWRSGKVSPTLKNYEAAEEGLRQIISEMRARLEAHEHAS